MNPTEFSTKQKGDIAEYATMTELMRRGYALLKPIGDRLPYDVAVEYSGKICRLQVKSAWFDRNSGNYLINTHRSQTNRRHYKIRHYQPDDFDFLIGWIAPLNVWYVVPMDFVLTYTGAFSMREVDRRQRAPKSREFREQWDQIDGFLGIDRLAAATDALVDVSPISGVVGMGLVQGEAVESPRNASECA